MRWRNDDVLPVHLDQVHGSEEAAHVALHTSRNKLHEVGDHELLQAAVSEIEEGSEGIDGNLGIHHVEDGRGDEVRNSSKGLIRDGSRAVLVGVQEISRNFETKLQGSNLSCFKIVLLAYKANKQSHKFPHFI